MALFRPKKKPVVINFFAHPPALVLMVFNWFPNRFTRYISYHFLLRSPTLGTDHHQTFSCSVRRWNIGQKKSVNDEDTKAKSNESSSLYLFWPVWNQMNAFCPIYITMELLQGTVLQISMCLKWNVAWYTSTADHMIPMSKIKILFLYIVLQRNSAFFRSGRTSLCTT